MAGKLRKLLVLTLYIMLLTPALSAQETSFRLNANNLNLQRGVSSTFVLSIINAQDARVLNIEGIENFDVVSQSQSSSTSIVNRNVTRQLDIHYTIIPKNSGQFTLKANIQYNNQVHETNTLQVNVSDGANNTGGSASDLFVNTIISHSEAYLGEKISVTYELYSRNSIDNYRFTDYTAIDGIIARDMPEDRLRAEYVYVDGLRYVKYEIRQLLLDPIRSGIYTIPSFNLQVNVITTDSSGSMFGSGPGSLFGMGPGLINRSVPVYLQTDAKQLTIKPLPQEGRPSDFSGIVGELNLEGSYSREQVNYGEFLSFQATISGNCNLDGFRNISAGGIPGFTVYETLKNTVESVINSEYRVQKEFELVMVPERTGTLDVPPFSISYFNPVTEKYERATIPGISVEVTGEMPRQFIGDGGSAQTVIIDQVSYVQPNDDYYSLRIKKEDLYRLLIGIAVLLVLVVVTVLLVLKWKKQDQTLRNLYRQIMKAKDVNETYSLFNTMMKHCYSLSIKASSKNSVRYNLADAELAEKTVDVMDYMESPKAHEEKGNIHLKEKIRVIYNLKDFRQRRKNYAISKNHALKGTKNENMYL